MSRPTNEEHPLVSDSPHFSGEPDVTAPAWMEIDTGRFMPRRVRGSFQGRALG